MNDLRKQPTQALINGIIDPVSRNISTHHLIVLLERLIDGVETNQEQIASLRTQKAGSDFYGFLAVLGDSLVKQAQQAQQPSAEVTADNPPSEEPQYRIAFSFPNGVTSLTPTEQVDWDRGCVGYDENGHFYAGDISDPDQGLQLFDPRVVDCAELESRTAEYLTMPLQSIVMKYKLIPIKGDARHDG